MAKFIERPAEQVHEQHIAALTEQLRASAELRWGRERATELTEAIAAAAATLADVALVAFAADDAEPDFNVAGGR
jgi:hypothetical protein